MPDVPIFSETIQTQLDQSCIWKDRDDCVSTDCRGFGGRRGRLRKGERVGEARGVAEGRKVPEEDADAGPEGRGDERTGLFEAQ